MNRAGNWQQPAASFTEFLQQIIVEVCAFRIELSKIHWLEFQELKFETEADFWAHWDARDELELDYATYSDPILPDHWNEGRGRVAMPDIVPLAMTLNDAGPDFAEVSTACSHSSHAYHDTPSLNI